MSFLALCKSERPLILPGAFDALSARLIKQAGFKAYFTGGFPTIGARWGLPDIGLVALGEIASAVADIVKASDLSRTPIVEVTASDMAFPQAEPAPWAGNTRVVSGRVSSCSRSEW